jgi:protein scribble
MEGARHDQAVSMLTGLERFVRLVVSRETLVPKSQLKTFATATPKPYFGTASSSTTGSKSPMLSPDSYLANRPSFTGLRRSYGTPSPTPTPVTTTTATPAALTSATSTTMATATTASAAVEDGAASSAVVVAAAKPPILGPKPQVAPRTKSIDNQDLKLPKVCTKNSE